MDKPSPETPAPQPGADASAELMPVKCSICGEWMDVKPGHINYISHGICPTCYEREMSKLRRES